MANLKGKTILFSGVFKGYDRVGLERTAEKAGAKLLSGVSKNLNYLVAGEKMGPSKHDKASELGVPIITLKDFFALLKGKGIATKSAQITNTKVAAKKAGPAVFTDFGFKLMVIQELMYEQKIMKPKFSVSQFIKNYKGKEIRIPFNKMIPEVKAYFKALEIPGELLGKVKKLNASGGNNIYMNISPDWDGEDRMYDIKSARDSKLLPNLKKVFLYNSDNPNILEDFEKLGVKAEWI